MQKRVGLALVSALAIGAWACSSPAGPHGGGTGGDEDTGGSSGDTGGKSGGDTGGKQGGTGGSSTGGSMGNTGGAGDTGGSMGNTGGSGGSTGGSGGKGGGGGSAGSAGGSGGEGGAMGGSGGGGGDLSFMVLGLDETQKYKPWFPPSMCKTANGQHSPAMKWTGMPAGTKSFAMVMIDTGGTPQAGKPLVAGGNKKVHFVFFDIPATATELPANLPRKFDLGTPMGAKGSQNFDSYGWFGPGGGLSVYSLTLYALDVDTLGLTMSTATQNGTYQAVLKHVVGKPSTFLVAGVTSGVP